MNVKLKGDALVIPFCGLCGPLLLARKMPLLSTGVLNIVVLKIQKKYFLLH